MAAPLDNFFPALLGNWKKHQTLDDEQLKSRILENSPFEKFPLERYLSGELFPGSAERNLFYRILNVPESETAEVEKRALIYLESEVHQDLFAQLCRACRENDGQRVHELLRKGIELDSRDDKGCTPLHYAVATGNPELVISLLECCASAGMLNLAGKDPMDLACEAGDVEIVSCCLNYGQHFSEGHEWSIGRSNLDEPRLIDLFLQQQQNFQSSGMSEPTSLMLLAERGQTKRTWKGSKPVFPPLGMMPPSHFLRCCRFSRIRL